MPHANFPRSLYALCAGDGWQHETASASAAARNSLAAWIALLVRLDRKGRVPSVRLRLSCKASFRKSSDFVMGNTFSLYKNLHLRLPLNSINPLEDLLTYKSSKGIIITLPQMEAIACP